MVQVFPSLVLWCFPPKYLDPGVLRGYTFWCQINRNFSDYQHPSNPSTLDDSHISDKEITSVQNGQSWRPPNSHNLTYLELSRNISLIYGTNDALATHIIQALGPSRLAEVSMGDEPPKVVSFFSLFDSHIWTVTTPFRFRYYISGE